MRQGQRQPSRFQPQTLEAQAHAGSATSEVADGVGEEDTPMSSLLAAWESPDLLALIKQVSKLVVLTQALCLLHRQLSADQHVT